MKKKGIRIIRALCQGEKVLMDMTNSNVCSVQKVLTIKVL
jgi:hypothetical protein